jgi:hypothetical protein
MRITIRLPDDVMEKVALDALKKRYNSKEVVISEILRAHYAGGDPQERSRQAIEWRIPSRTEQNIKLLRQRAKHHWI